MGIWKGGGGFEIGNGKDWYRWNGMLRVVLAWTARSSNTIFLVLTMQSTLSLP